MRFCVKRWWLAINSTQSNSNSEVIVKCTNNLNIAKAVYSGTKQAIRKIQQLLQSTITGVVSLVNPQTKHLVSVNYEVFEKMLAIRPNAYRIEYKSRNMEGYEETATQWIYGDILSSKLQSSIVSITPVYIEEFQPFSKDELEKFLKYATMSKNAEQSRAKAEAKLQESQETIANLKTEIARLKEVLGV